MAQKDFGPTSDLGPTGRSIHTKFYTPAANKNDCDMGIVHDYRYVNTENLFRALSDSERQYSRYDFTDLLSQAYREYTDVGNQWLTKYVTARPVESSDSFYNVTELNFSGFPDFETRDTDLTLAAGEKYTVNQRTYYFNSFNIIAASTAYDVTTAKASDVLSGYTFYNYSGSALTKLTGTMTDLKDYRYAPGATLQFRRGKTSYTDATGATKSISATNFITIYQQATGRVQYSHELMMLASRFGNATPDQVLSSASFTSENSGSIGNTGTIVKRTVEDRSLAPEGSITYQAGYYDKTWTVKSEIPVTYINANGGSKLLTLTENTWFNYFISVPGTGSKSAYSSFNILVDVPQKDHVQSCVNDYQAYPLLITRQRTLASGYNNMVVLPNSGLGPNGSMTNWPASQYTGQSLYSGEVANNIFNYALDPDAGGEGPRPFFNRLTLNSSTGLQLLSIEYSGWYKLEVTCTPGNTAAQSASFVNIYAFRYEDYLKTNTAAIKGDFDNIGSPYCNRLMTVYMNDYSRNTSGRYPQVSGHGYGFIYIYLSSPIWLGGRMNGATEATRVCEFRLGLVYNSALKILR